MRREAFSSSLLITLAAIAVLWYSLDGGGRLAVASAASNPVPVTINSCGPIIDKNQTQNYFGVNVPVSTSGGIKIEFVNESKQTATLVNFAVDSGGESFVIRDVGTFSPEVSIKHQYRNGQGQSFVLPAFIAPNVKCHVASVEFADGTLWRRGQTASSTQPVAPAQSPPSAALTVSPTSVNIEKVTNSALFMVTSSSKVAAFKESDDCAGIAKIFVAAMADSAATYSIRPLAAGACTAKITDDDGNTISVPISVK